MPSLLSIKGLKKYFPMPKPYLFSKEKPYLRAVEDVTLCVNAGETYGLVGESGCGKSTLGRTVLQLQRATGGEVIYYKDGKGVDLTKLTDKQMRAYRRDLQIIFQDPYSSLNPRMTVGQIIEEGVATHAFHKRGTEEMQKYVLEIMQKCGLQAHALGRYPHQFSGGQRQRVCIARALAVKPKFVVCDECVSALDVSVQAQILNLLQELKVREGLTYLFISHDLSVVRHIADTVGVMYLGRIVEQGKAEDVFESPLHPYTIALISAAPSAEKEGRKERILLSGQMPNPIFVPTGCPFHTRCFMAQECCKSGEVPLIEAENGRLVACHFAKMPTEEKRRLAKKRE